MVIINSALISFTSIILSNSGALGHAFSSSLKNAGPCHQHLFTFKSSQFVPRVAIRRLVAMSAIFNSVGTYFHLISGDFLISSILLLIKIGCFS
ncbi:unnamed protein product [Meloidogyne enterolobii]|uniref:Uncharacterized protein n=1 Tax=Meloidogyne enterolobii TaxID=390850 RepID=A0ACB0ZNZ4_MELEN